MRRGEVRWANLPPPWGRRPVLLLVRDEAYALLSWVMVAPLTTTFRDVPTQVRLDPSRDGVARTSLINLAEIQSIRPEWLDALIVRLRPEKMAEVERAIHFALDLRT